MNIHGFITNLLKVLRTSSVVFFIMASVAHSSIVINNTRVIYLQKEKEVTVQINNQGTDPLLLQSWLDDGDSNAKPDNLKVPFMLTPPINRVDAGKSQTVRIRYTGSNLPTDRESMYWFNALEIPAKARMNEEDERNILQMAFRTRIKLFFRPEGLKGEPEKAAQQLRWVNNATGITAVNDTPWHISLVQVIATVNGNNRSIEGNTVAPFSKLSFPLKGASSGSPISWSYVNDYGAVQHSKTTLSR